MDKPGVVNFRDICNRVALEKFNNEIMPSVQNAIAALTMALANVEDHCLSGTEWREREDEVWKNFNKLCGMLGEFENTFYDLGSSIFGEENIE